ncbi:MAG: hypothetical protein O3A00_16490, partial [Planctomycetota bacterium]|nr:hypothetical protein [Planctomycetota bacterium]
MDNLSSLPGGCVVTRAGAMKTRLTAQLILSETEAFLAYSVPSDSRDNGETHTAVLLRTSDAGRTWACVPLRRTFVDHFCHVGIPTWPPEAITELTKGKFGIQFVFRDEWVPFEWAGESLWHAFQRRNGKWSTSRIRFMDYEGADSPIEVPEVVL